MALSCTRVFLHHPFGKVLCHVFAGKVIGHVFTAATKAQLPPRDAPCVIFGELGNLKATSSAADLRNWEDVFK